jgi:hypothetical protein
LFTAILSPLFLYFLFKERDLKSLLSYAILLIIPIPFHLLNGIEISSYLFSSALLLTAWIFLFTSIHAIKKLNTELEKMFKVIISINSLLVMAALVILPFAAWRSLMWYSIPISPNISPFPRLDMFAYEPSHYALLLAPVFMFFLIKAISGNLKHAYLYVIASVVPLILSISFGVVAAFIIALLITVIINHRRFPERLLKAWSYGMLSAIVTFMIVVIIWPENAIWQRILNIFSGADTSARGRLHNSFMFAWDLVNQNNMLFGVGPGQVKVLAHDLIINFYKYTGEYAEVVRIPNSMGEMLATYGLFGFILKIFFEIYFFVKTKVYNNVYALALFIFIFIYQFTGSFLVNAAELGTWALVYCFRPDFSIKRKSKEGKE